MKLLRSLSKLSRWSTLIGLSILFGLVLLVRTASSRPFNLWARIAVLLSPYRTLLPYIVAQSKHETANFTSRIYKTHRNLFGMKQAFFRPQLGTPGDESPEGGKYQRYTGDLQSIRDFLIYLDYTKFPQTVTDSHDYATKIASRFRVDPGIYLNGINHYLRQAA